VLLGTRNPGKLREIQDVLGDLELRLLSLADFPEVSDVEETGGSFLENARLKAEHYRRQTGLPSLADDSGLVVDALDGRPGVLSARFAPTDPERILKLLELMRPFPAPERRSARFVCAICLAADWGSVEVEGRVEGLIAARPSGSHGFGYDPIFYYPPMNKTFAEMTAAEKNCVSHRFVALGLLREKLTASDHDH
jgi:XTP/dITP diphosphohydrolase